MAAPTPTQAQTITDLGVIVHASIKRKDDANQALAELSSKAKIHEVDDLSTLTQIDLDEALKLIHPTFAGKLREPLRQYIKPGGGSGAVGNVKATFSALVRKRDPLIAVDLHVIERAIKRFAPRVQLAVAVMDPELAYDIYDEAHRLPATYTELELNTDFGYQINGNLIRDNDNLVICFKDTTPYILKMLTTKEYQAMMQIKERLPPHNHIIQIMELIQVKHGKQFAIMPILPTTLEGLLKFTPTTALRFWNQMASALEAFHQIRFSHNDVKPANICLGPTGDFVLIDLGSVAEFGARVASTTAYHPKVAKDSELKFNVASASLDWWMLAAVLTEKACGLEWGVTSNPPVSVVQQLLEEKLPQVWEKLRLKLSQGV